MQKIKLYIIDDHQIVRDGLKALFDKNSNIQIVGESSGDELPLKMFETVHPDVILMDISLGENSGILLTKAILDVFPQVKVIVLSMYNDESIIFDAIKSGAKGYLPKSTSKQEIIQAIMDVFEGKQYFNQDIAMIMLDSVINQKKNEAINSSKQSLDCLSNREIQILQLFAEGLTNQEIANSLNISVRTVESHKTHIMQKLDLKSTVEMVKFAIKNGLTEV